MELAEIYERFEGRGLLMVGVALEEKAEADAPQFLDRLGGVVPFPIVADVGRQVAPRLEPTTAYLVDGEGIVRQVFPMLTYARGSTDAILREVDRILELGE